MRCECWNILLKVHFSVTYNKVECELQFTLFFESSSVNLICIYLFRFQDCFLISSFCWLMHCLCSNQLLLNCSKMLSSNSRKVTKHDRKLKEFSDSGQYRETVSLRTLYECIVVFLAESYFLWSHKTDGMNVSR